MTNTLQPKKVLSGMRPSGKLHIGNYLGALKGMISLQDNPEYDTLYTSVDVHAITTPYNKDTLATERRNIIVDYLAAGLDPNKSIIFIQSQVPQHLELAMYFSSVITVARMQHLPTFKDKVKQFPEHVTMALLNYPVLMAADILIYKAELVPVGLDQEPHIEVAREIARKMNEAYNTNFPEPQRFDTPGRNIPSLMGDGKMSKSVEGSYIALTDSLDEIKQKLYKVPTDSGQGDVFPETGPAANLLSFVEIFEGESKKQDYLEQYKTSGIRYKDLKDTLAQAIYSELEPIQQRRKEITSDTTYVDDILKEGAAKASALATLTMTEVKEKMGF